jgi:hypothetical protein
VCGHLLVSPVQLGFVAAGPRNTSLQVIRYSDGGNAAQELEGAEMGADPVGQALRPRGFGEGVVTGAEDGNKDGGGLQFAGDGVGHREGVAGIVDEEFFAGAMFLPEHDILALEPVTVEVAEAAVPVAIGVLQLVLLPEELQGEVLVNLELAADGGEVGFGVFAADCGGVGRGGEGLLDAILVPVGDVWPAELGVFGLCQIV